MKKEIPIEVLLKIEMILDPYKKLGMVKLVPSTAAWYHFIDVDPKSNFYFSIFQTPNDTHPGNYKISFSPRNRIDTSQYNGIVDVSGLAQYFNDWLKILHDYNSLQTVFDLSEDVKAHQSYYFGEFKVDEVDADQVPFDPPRILIIDRHLERIADFLNERKTTENAEAIEQIQADCDELRNDLPSITKNEAIKGVAKIWAKITSMGTKMMKALWTGFKEEGMKQLGKAMASEIFEQVQNINP